MISPKTDADQRPVPRGRVYTKDKKNQYSAQRFNPLEGFGNASPGRKEKHGSLTGILYRRDPYFFLGAEAAGFWLLRLLGESSLLSFQGKIDFLIAEHGEA